MTSTTFIYGKPLNEREVADYHRILAQAFGWSLEPALNPAAEEGMANLRLLRRSARVIGGLSFQPCRQFFGGRAVSMAGVRIVAISPDMRGQGAATTLMEAAVREQRERGWLLSTLHPAMRGLYRKSGYEVAGDSCVWELPLNADLPPEEHGLTLKPFDLGNASAMSAMRHLYDAHAQKSDGWLERSDWYWSRIFRPPAGQGGSNKLHAYLFEGERGPEGYLIYHQGSGTDGGVRLIVRDWVASTFAARRRLLAFFREQRSVCDLAVINAGEQEALLALRDEASHPVQKNQPWMMRLLDVQAALEARGYSPGVSCELHLGIKDPLIAENERPLVLTVEAGRGAVRVGGESRILLDIRGLAALYSGYMTPYMLRGMGLLDAADADMSRLMAVFAGPRPWMPERF